MKEVALRKESVDRNYALGGVNITETPSLSARRAWIEIGLRLWPPGMRWVALRKESVDRNHRVGNIPLHIVGRSPQGERG